MCRNERGIRLGDALFVFCAFGFCQRMPLVALYLLHNALKGHYGVSLPLEVYKGTQGKIRLYVEFEKYENMELLCIFGA